MSSSGAPWISVDDFRPAAIATFGFLEQHGFSRLPEAERMSATVGSLVYAGKHVGFIISLDVRDQCIDVEVVKVVGGRLHDNAQGGYSSALVMHLVTHAGYRGARSRSVSSGSADPLQHMLDRWRDLILQAGRSLLEDRDDSLPA